MARSLKVPGSNVFGSLDVIDHLETGTPDPLVDWDIYFDVSDARAKKKGAGAAGGGTENESAVSGAITVSVGRATLTYAGASAYTLAAPTADNQIMEIIDLSGYAHTVTTPANIINGDSSVITFSAIKGASVRLYSLTGVWYVYNAYNVSSIV